jgi:hypothetical protein
VELISQCDAFGWIVRLRVENREKIQIGFVDGSLDVGWDGSALTCCAKMFTRCLKQQG